MISPKTTQEDPFRHKCLKNNKMGVKRVTCRREATLAVQEGLSELSSEYLGATGPQGLNTPGRGDKNNNLSMLMFCRRNRKDIFTKKG